MGHLGDQTGPIYSKIKLKSDINYTKLLKCLRQFNYIRSLTRICSTIIHENQIMLQSTQWYREARRIARQVARRREDLRDPKKNFEISENFCSPAPHILQTLTNRLQFFSKIDREL